MGILIFALYLSAKIYIIYIKKYKKYKIILGSNFLGYFVLLVDMFQQERARHDGIWQYTKIAS